MKVKDVMAKAMQAANSAQLLVDAGDADGACNHAYCAMFDAARAALLASGQGVGKTHHGVLLAFSEHWVKKWTIAKTNRVAFETCGKLPPDRCFGMIVPVRI